MNSFKSASFKLALCVAALSSAWAETVVAYGFWGNSSPNFSQWSNTKGDLSPQGNGVFSGTITAFDQWSPWDLVVPSGASVKLTKALFGGKDTLHVWQEGSTLVTASQKPQMIWLYNPWPSSVPGIALNGNPFFKMSSSPDSTLCGWYAAWIKQGSNPKLLFVDVLNSTDADNGVYGKDGMGSPLAIDLGTNAADSAIWIHNDGNGSAPELKNSSDGVSGQCGYRLALIVRDLSYNRDDFEFHYYAGNPNSMPAGATMNGSTVFGCADPKATLGMVQNQLGTDGLPVANGSGLCKNELVKEWFTTTMTPSGKQNLKCVDLPMRLTDAGLWEYDSWKDTKQGVFFPIDDFNPWNDPTFVARAENKNGGYDPAGNHNFHFCSQTGGKFQYKKGQTFTFSGDDDFWLYVDGKLALDLGGVHPKVEQALNLDLLASSNGWTEGSSHEMKIFHCERNTDGSNFKVQSNIFLKQSKGLECTDIGGGKMSCITLSGGTGDCSSWLAGGDTLRKNSSLSYSLIGPWKTIGKSDTMDLNPGVFPKTWFGGIQLLDTNSYQFNATAMSGLNPGRYAFRYCESSRGNTLCETKTFSIRGKGGIFNPNPDTVLAGTSAKVIVGNVISGKAIADTMSYVLALPPGVTAYLDSAMTRRAPDTLKTKTTGLDTIWVSSPRSASDHINAQISVAGGDGSKKVITFLLPQLRFTDSLGIPLALPKVLGKWSFLHYPVFVQAYTDRFGVCTACAGDTLTLYPGSRMHTKATPSGAEVNQVVVDANGLARFWSYADTSVSQGTLEVELNTNQVTPRPLRPSYAIWADISLQEPPVPKVVRNQIKDKNGDGIADRLEIEFAPFTASGKVWNVADTLPLTFSYRWPETGPLRTASLSELKAALTDPNTLVFEENYTDTIKTSGAGQVEYTYQVEGLPFRIPRDIQDAIGPVVKRADMQLNKTRDRLTIQLSERVLKDSVTFIPNQPWIEFMKDGQKQQLTHTFLGWSDSGSRLDVAFAADLDPKLKAVVGDSVRLITGNRSLNPNLLRDRFGNVAHVDNRWEKIVGKKRVWIPSINLVEANLETSTMDSSFKIVSYPVGTEIQKIKEEEGRLGFVVPFDAFANFQRDALNNFIDPDALSLKVDIAIYTNIGGSVANRVFEIKCSDPLFGGNCNQDGQSKDLFIAWNLRSDDGRKAGTGAYIARLNWAIQINRSTPTNGSGQKEELWGLRRTQQGASLQP